MADSAWLTEDPSAAWAPDAVPTLPTAGLPTSEDDAWFQTTTYRSVGLPPMGALGGAAETTFPGTITAGVAPVKGAAPTAQAVQVRDITSLVAPVGASLPPLAFMPSATHFSVPIPADSLAGAGAAAQRLFNAVQDALAKLGATVTTEGSPFAVVAHSYDYRSYASVGFEVAVLRPAETPSADCTDALTPPSALLVDATRRNGDAFLFGSLYNELKTEVLAAMADAASGGAPLDGALPLAEEDCGVVRSAGALPPAPAGLASMSALPLDGEWGCDVLRSVGAPGGLAALPLDEEDALAAQEGSALLRAAGAPAASAGKEDLPAPAPLARAVSDDALHAVGYLLDAVTDGEAADVAVPAAQKLCELVVTDTAFGTRVPAPASATSALMSGAGHIGALAGAVAGLAAAPTPDLFMPLTVAAATALQAVPATSATADAVGRLRAALAAVSGSTFAHSAAVPAHVQAALARAL